MMQSVRTSAAVVSMLVGASALPGQAEQSGQPDRIQPAAAGVQPRLSSAILSSSQQKSVVEVADRITGILNDLPRVENSPIPAEKFRSPLGKLETPDLADGIPVWSEISRNASKGTVTLAEMRETLPKAYDSLNQLYLYTKFYRQGHAEVLAQEELFVIDGHPRAPGQQEACAKEVQKSNALLLRLAETVRGLTSLAGDLKIPLEARSPFEEKLDSISLKPGAQKAMRELLTYEAAARSELSESDRMIYARDEKTLSAVLAKVREGAPEQVTLDIHSFVVALTQTSVVLTVARDNQLSKAMQLSAQGELEHLVRSPAAQADLKKKLEQVNLGFDRIAELDRELQFMTKFVTTLAKAAGIQVTEPAGLK